MYNLKNSFSLNNTRADLMSSSFFPEVVVLLLWQPKLPVLMRRFRNRPAMTRSRNRPSDDMQPEQASDDMQPEQASDDTQPPPKSRKGRPSGSLSYSTIYKNRQAASMELARSRKKSASMHKIQKKPRAPKHLRTSNWR